MGIWDWLRFDTPITPLEADSLFFRRAKLMTKMQQDAAPVRRADAGNVHSVRRIHRLNPARKLPRWRQRELKALIRSRTTKVFKGVDFWAEGTLNKPRLP
jgi:hypothetical protein